MGAGAGRQIRGLDAGGWFDAEVGERDEPKSISHEHTFNHDTRDETGGCDAGASGGESGAAVARAWASCADGAVETAIFGFHHDHARAFAARPTQIDIDLVEHSRRLLQVNWDRRQAIRLIGIHASGFTKNRGN